ncbi:GATA transcription factor 8-like [Andrographis paniculata]|uniref:GATA transcription factor 8-like n=1 Tax=Andrographis paniculata TaxID=175694 RepID=UPI0021E839D7|nr:GATA transcription factor 8-like [Andrographis paniculata]XP_051120180.1 GATA transcription factor 8-like [Andrographis paniculata]
MDPNFGDEIDCGSFFDQIDDLIEFPSDNDCGDGNNFVSIDDCKTFTDMWSDPLPESDAIFPGGHLNSGSDLSAELSVPHEDIAQLEWLSTFMEDSFSDGGMTIGKDTVKIDDEKDPSVRKNNQFQMSSPVSEIESSTSSSSSSNGKIIPLGPNHHRAAQRARSKRPRPTTFHLRPGIQLISPSSSSVETGPRLPPGLSSESDNFVESSPAAATKKLLKPAGDEQKKKKKIKVTFSADPANRDPPPVRKCLHCEITKTPQWRAGPMGPKTLCNACGVRYKSGRLFPEYRPAASPTFIPSVHSNSHKKVVEMRNKIVPGPATPTPAMG